MENNYEEIVRNWYTRLRPEFLSRLTTKYSALPLYEAENLYQDAFIAIHDNLLKGRIRENTSWSNYILTIGMNLANKEIRKIGKTDSIDQDSEEDNENYPSKTARKADDILKGFYEEETPLYKNQEAQALLGDELAHTPEPCGSIVRLFYYDNLSMDEIAQTIGYKNATTAKAKKSQCMKDLIKRVKDVLHRSGITD